MKMVNVQEAVGSVLCHDITEIVPGEKKGRAFKKGHIVHPEDIPALLRIGKEHLYIWEMPEGTLHENDAAARIARAVCGDGVVLTEPCEGKVELRAAASGLLKVKPEALRRINSIEEIVVATLHSNQLVEAGRTLAGCRAVPLVIEEAKIAEVERIAAELWPIVELRTLRKLKVGIVTTGSEVFHGRIKDGFGPVVRRKVEELGSEVTRQILADDKVELIADAVRTLIDEGAELVLTTGGMSVDPDDVTPSGIRAAGGNVVVYGVPVLPGSMFMLAELNGVPILGLPGCVMYHRTTVLDLALPRILAGERLTRADFVDFGHGGLCSGCEPCVYPRCAFGKGF